ncbi:uncharacterized protein [Blastocystis hominis]|uniref:Glycine transporter domain-containing protein n=1 Tax=Blastocystis hominis TaxID=12968 RepID=D8M778_BLAHO|nr:uncharacterized protein [Blastocystis hominis]CBK23917.2 unnamed protein product [Blastocystis hominis]|eukprot:XP_012897965.1 uncharacterized protein [Blastocystis hominis]
MKGVSLCICTFLMCFGGSTMTNFVHGLMMGYLRRSTSFVSFLIGLGSVLLLPQSAIDSLFPTFLYQCFNFVVDCLLRIHCVTSWGVHTAISAGGSVVSATFASMATGCGGGMLATLLLDDSSSVWMDKLTRVLVKYKRELEHLLTLSLLYQALIGFLPLSFVSPMDFISAKSVCFVVFLCLHFVDRVIGIVIVWACIIDSVCFCLFR